jgi:hypothetical protein
MVRAFLHACILYHLLTFHSVSGQRLFGNEWIDRSQTYFKIPVAQTGLYKITGRELESAGVNLAEISPSAIQMFRRGKEIAIEIHHESDERLAADNDIIFYGEKNDGAADSSLYVSASAMPHRHYSLYSDTAAYFLTWRTDGGIGRRISGSELKIPTDTISHHFQKSFHLFNSHYLPGRFYPPESHFENGSVTSDYDVGEGWTGPELKENQSFEISFNLDNPVKDLFHLSEFEIVMVGWSAGQHLFEVWSGTQTNLKRKLSVIEFQDYQSTVGHAFLNTSDFDSGGKVTITLVPIGKGGHASVSYALFKYPQSTQFPRITTQKELSFNRSKNCFFLEIDTSAIDFYDCSDPFELRKLKKQGAGLLLDKASQVIAVRNTMQIEGIKPVDFGEALTSTYDYFIVTHPLMQMPVQGLDPVKEYATYRASPEGGNYKPLVLQITEVFDQFNYGDPGPQGLRNLISWLHNTGHAKFVFLIGKSVDPQKARRLSARGHEDMIPNAGWPGSDIALAMDPRDSSQTSPKIAIGRFNAENSQHVHDYLNKVKAMEAEPDAAPWRKNILHLSGGRTLDELLVFKEYVKSFGQKIRAAPLAATVKTMSKQTDEPVEQVSVHGPVNLGSALITLFGHSSLDVTDIDIGLASDPKRMYANHPRYPAIIVNGCASGSMFYSSKSLSSDWILTPNNGAILFLAHTFNGVSTSLKRYTDMIYEVIADSIYTSEPFGSIQQEAIRRVLSGDHDVYDRTTIQQMTLHGDPAIRIFPAKLPDYLIDSTTVGFFDPSGKELGSESDSVAIRLVIQNQGRYRKEDYQLRIQRIIDSSILDQVDMKLPAVPIADTLYFNMSNKPPISTSESWILQIDPDNRLTEENELNNKLEIRPAMVASKPFETDHIPPVMMVTIDGRYLANNDQVSVQPTIGIDLFDSHLSANDTSAVAIWLKEQCQGCADKRIYLRDATFKKVSENLIRISLTLPDKLNKGSYKLTVRARDLFQNDAPLYQLLFRVSEQNTISELHVSPNPSERKFKITFRLDGSVPIEGVRFQVFTMAGKELVNETFALHPGLNERIWDPGASPSGICIYRITMPPDTPRLSQGAGQALQGRLIWNR